MSKLALKVVEKSRPKIREDDVGKAVTDPVSYQPGSCRHRFVQEDENSCLCEGLAGHVGPVLVAEQARRMRFTNMMPEALK